MGFRTGWLSAEYACRICWRISLVGAMWSSAVLEPALPGRRIAGAFASSAWAVIDERHQRMKPEASLVCWLSLFLVRVSCS